MILCSGESLIDMVPQDGTFRPLAGGAVYNTAIALGRLGVAAGYLWPLSSDQFGATLRQPLLEAGVATDLCPQSARPTTLAFVTLDRGEARYSFYDEGSAGRMFAQSDLPELPSETRALFIGGISLVPDPCGATVETLVDHARDRGIPVMIDPNIRPFFITEIPRYRARLERLIAKSALVKLSGDDIAWLWPDADFAEVSRDLLARGPDAGPSVIFRTLGADGAEATSARHHITLPAARVAITDTIGAGDTFNAGVLAALDRADAFARLDHLERETLEAALSLGIRAAAVTVSRAGANPPWRHELA
ncbi:carbohydrate kinase [Paracoccus cavernae]|uniref:Carbohydrate kinase n=1 Tax=Paracoccus cavernae TaxID=1571207 RepID=A0ABT8DA21_9RHOB|nr:carbohydrate kinase [Paracoccus cavernae]